MTLKRGYKVLLDEANKVIDSIPVEEAIALIDDENAVLIDIRDIRELEREGKIKGAYHAPRGMLEFWADPDCKYHKDVFSSGKKLVFYCASAWRSALATKTLQDMGLENICHIEGGFSALKAAHAPIEDI